MSGGQTALALRLLLAAFSSKISSDINRPFGDEVVLEVFYQMSVDLGRKTTFDKAISVMQFRAARKASEEVGAQIVLGDRPIEITVCT